MHAAATHVARRGSRRKQEWGESSISFGAPPLQDKYMTWIKKVIKNIAALLIGIILSFFILEGILRIYNPFEYRVKGDNIVLPANKKYVIKRENDRKLISKFDDTIIHTKNSLGFRGEEPPVDFKNNLTIITVGGSTTECTFLSDGKTWTDLLGIKIKKDIKNVWINNAGFDGHSTFGHRILMEDYIIKLKPDIVLFLVGANDLGYNISEKDQEFMRNRFIFSSLKSFLKSMANHSEVFSLGLNMYRYYKAKKIGVEHQELDFETFRNGDINSYLTEDVKKIQKETINDYKNKNLKGFEKRLKGIVEISKNNNIIPVLITQPALYGDFVDDVTNIDFKFTRFIWELLELYNDTTRKVGIEENILVIDLAREMPKSTRYYYDWLHFSNEGAEKVAEIIYNNVYPYLTGEYSKQLTM